MTKEVELKEGEVVVLKFGNTKIKVAHDDFTFLVETEDEKTLSIGWGFCLLHKAEIEPVLKARFDNDFDTCACSKNIDYAGV